MTDIETLDAIRHVVNVQIAHNDSDEGDKYLSQSAYAMEAIDAILNGINSGIVRQFLSATIS
jgi:hypothetical protein